MAFSLNIGKCSLLGNYRENNEDSIEVKKFPDMSVCIVADGMGGQAYGEIASKRAIIAIPNELGKNLASSANTDQAKNVLRKAVVQGSVLASYNVEKFSLERMRSLTPKDVADRYEVFRQMSHFELDL